MTSSRNMLLGSTPAREVGSDSAAKGKPHAERAPKPPRPMGRSGLDEAMSAHADQVHPKTAAGPSLSKAGY